jgi:hypothetical protein
LPTIDIEYSEVTLFLYILQSSDSYLELCLNCDISGDPTVITEGIITDGFPENIFKSDVVATIKEGNNIMTLRNTDPQFPLQVWYPRLVASYPVYTDQGGLTVLPFWTGNFAILSN